jgi:hypothetical protein
MEVKSGIDLASSVIVVVAASSWLQQGFLAEDSGLGPGRRPRPRVEASTLVAGAPEQERGGRSRGRTCVPRDEVTGRVQARDLARQVHQWRVRPRRSMERHLCRVCRVHRRWTHLRRSTSSSAAAARGRGGVRQGTHGGCLSLMEHTAPEEERGIQRRRAGVAWSFRNIRPAAARVIARRATVVAARRGKSGATRRGTGMVAGLQKSRACSAGRTIWWVQG